jgi:hypothetical protein
MPIQAKLATVFRTPVPHRLLRDFMVRFEAGAE